jgi:hypothetical protein
MLPKNKTKIIIDQLHIIILKALLKKNKEEKNQNNLKNKE